MLPAEFLLAFVEDRVLDWRPGARGLLFLEPLDLIQPLDEQQVGHLLDDFHGVGDAAGPEGVPDGVDLRFDGAGDHEWQLVEGSGRDG